jgi:DNA helicase II / ATP-dependent DNA helicase PcrA
MVLIATDNNSDDPADKEIQTSLNLERPVSFFLFADAGSGKTRSLVKGLEALRTQSAERLRLRGQRIGVITYTNAACDEITSRLEFDPLIMVSTIHSFVWSLISGHNSDIKAWLRASLGTEIANLREQQQKGRPGTKAAMLREESVKSKQKRLLELDGIRQFTYNPNGENRDRDSLNHSEVIKIGADFIAQKPLMRSILINKFPVLLIDESQDTNKALIESLLRVQAEFRHRFCLGLFGDVMQRIYADGKEDLGRDLPHDWARPSKKLNHRSPRRIIKLINAIRSPVDGHEQVARSDSHEGVARLFVLNSATSDKSAAEQAVASEMARVAGDPLWSSSSDVKTLVLEHHMAARRMGFSEMFEALNEDDSLQTGLRDGSLPPLRFFSQIVLPLRNAKVRRDEFSTAAIVRSASPLLSKAALKATGTNQERNLQRARDAVRGLMALWENGGKPRFIDVLKSISRSNLFDVPDSLRPFTSVDERPNRDAITDEDQSDTSLAAWEKFLETPFSQIEAYDRYVRGSAPFDTHQGVKGREFDRVMVIMDDEEARGFMFSYEKLFDARQKSDADLKNESEGKETSVDRTRRLFYVTCSRAKISLAVVAYSANPESVKQHAISSGWFDQSEVQLGI